MQNEELLKLEKKTGTNLTGVKKVICTCCLLV
jgi:hypothetical protein